MSPLVFSEACSAGCSCSSISGCSCSGSCCFGEKNAETASPSCSRPLRLESSLRSVGEPRDVVASAQPGLATGGIWNMPCLLASRKAVCRKDRGGASCPDVGL